MTRSFLGRSGRTGAATVLLTLLAMSGAAWAQDRAQYPIRKPASPPPAQAPGAAQTPDKTAAEPDKPADGWMTETRKKSVEIGSQPARDVGLMKRQIPPILVEAQDDPYSVKGLKTCKQLAAEVVELNAVLGPDYTVGNEVKENKAGKLAEAGGKTVINTIIPFRGLVRELTGAAPADRRLNAALDAGYARRGFLRGVHAKQGCRMKF
jgi:hypothetical protein